MEKLKVKMMLAVGFAIVTLLPAVIGQEKAPGYGQKCTDDASCFVDVREPLRCIREKEENPEGRCGCLQGMFHHFELGICVSPENGTCTVKAEDGQYVLRCTENAQCYPVTATCHCDPDTQHDPLTGECKFSFGSERCSKETDCDTASFLICREGKCECNDAELQIYDEGARKCKALVGGSCSTAANNPLLPVCIGPGMECKTGKCACTGELEETADHKCGLVYDKECDAEKICAEPFWCDLEADEKKCQCRPNQEYSSGTCVILAGGTCSTENSLECTAHATCTDELCTCDASNYVAVNGKCVGLYGANCTGVGCNDSDFLECTQNVCTCKQNYNKDDANKKCIGRINQPCKSEQDHNDCVANSECRSSGSELRCTCPQNYQGSSDNQKCNGLYGASCDDLITCSSDHLLACNESLCHCSEPENHVYDENKELCVAKANKPCSFTGCVENSICNADNNICTCVSGYTGNDEGLCVVGGKASAIVGSSVLFAITWLITLKTFFV